MDQTPFALLYVEAVEDDRATPVRTATPQSASDMGSKPRRQPKRSLVHQRCPLQVTASRALRLTTPPPTSSHRLPDRTAVCGPACTVVWEGVRPEAPSYPDH